MTRDQIIEQKIKSSKAFLQEHYKVGRIGVFGSVARGEVTPAALKPQLKNNILEQVIYT